jgi:iron complex outermembrane receptor protein
MRQTSGRSLCCATVLVAAVLLPSLAPAQSGDIDIAELTLEELLAVELTSTASKFPQEVTRAPASVTVVTADEIRLRGYRTFADVLDGVRGLYTSNDRNYTYVGVRGFARPGDYNTRVLVLVDGHRLNEPVYDMAPVGTDFPLDVSLIQRVEVIRGPASSLYGTSAFFAVINVITKPGSDHDGVRLSGSTGSLSTHGATASVGHVFSGGNELLLAASARGSAGMSRLYFPEFDTGAPGSGVAVDADGDSVGSLFASAVLGRVRVRGAFVERRKDVPTGSFGTVFNDGRARTVDRRAFIDIAYTGPFGGAWTGVARAGVDAYRYTGDYPYDYGEDVGTVVWRDGADAAVVSGELTLNRRFDAHVVTVGTEARRVVRARQWAEDLFGPLLDESHPSTVFGLYAQDEVTLRRWLLLNAGVRLDRQDEFGARVTPRAGLVFLPRGQTAVKLLYGRAFRAPNSYERYYYETMRQGHLLLEPETIDTTELVWEEYVGAETRTAVSLFRYDAERLIEQRSLGVDELGDPLLYFVNAGRTTAHGIEMEIERRWRGGLVGAVSYSHVRASDRALDAPLSNSPRHLVRSSLVVPIRALASTASLNVNAAGRRRAVDGSTVGAFGVADVVTTTALGRRLELGLGLYNVLDRRYGHPGAEEHLQRSIVQDGRTFRAQLTARF